MLVYPASIGNVLTEKDSIIREDLGTNNFYAKRLGVDITRHAGPLILRSEFIIGEDGDETVRGGIAKADYALTSKLELNLKYAYWQRNGDRNFVGAGFSYELQKGCFSESEMNMNLVRRAKMSLQYRHTLSLPNSFKVFLNCYCLFIYLIGGICRGLCMEKSGKNDDPDFPGGR